MSLPNLITILRFLLVPVFIVVFFYEGRGFSAAAIFFLCGLSDVADGYIARRFNMITKLGQALDPLADKFMVIAVVFCLWYKDIMSIWIVAGYILKELVMIIGGTLLMKKDNKVLPARWYGKVSTALFFVITVVVLYLSNIDFSVSSNYLLVNLLFAGSFFFSLVGFVNYLILYKRLRKE